MRLLDQVAQTTTPFLVAVPERRNPVELYGAANLAPILREAPIRYVCEQEVTALCTHVSLDYALLARCLDLARAPAPQMWIEWDEGVRAEVLYCDEAAGQAQRRNVGKRAGMLIMTGESGRAGSIHICWNPVDLPDLVDVAPIVIEFDLDDPTYAGGGGAGCVDPRIADCENFQLILSHLRFRMRPDWLRYYQDRCGPEQLREVALENARAVVRDFNTFLAATLLLSARVGPLERRQVSRDAVNQGRLRRRRPALLDHVELTATLASNADAGGYEAVGAHMARRLHVVCGHLVRRASAVFWRRSHWRGSAAVGIIATRTVTLRQARSA
jgi:hypothetical protein